MMRRFLRPGAQPRAAAMGNAPPKLTPQEQLKKYQKELKKAIRSLEREERTMSRNQEKIARDIRKAAKEGQSVRTVHA